MNWTTVRTHLAGLVHERLTRPLMLALTLVSAGVQAQQDSVTVGVLSFRPAAVGEAQWRPLVDYLNRTVQGVNFVLRVYDYPQQQEAVRQQAVDIIITQPGEYVRLVHQNGLSSPLATLISLEQDKPVRAMGGVILARSDRTDLHRLEDLQGRRVAAVSRISFGGYQIQAGELAHRNIQPATIVETGLPQDKSVEALLAGHVDAAFVRTGLLESLLREGRIQPGQLKVLGQQDYPGYPYALSSRLYPEWPVVAMSHVPEELSVRIAGALLSLPHGSELARRMGLYGFTVPADYESVRVVMRDLRVAPFDAPTPIRLHDIWQQYRWPLLAALLALTALLALAARELYQRRRLAASHAQIYRLAFNDTLTGLPNRRLFIERLQATFENQLHGALIYLDLDHFKQINDTLGLHTGDALLQAVAQRFSSLLTDSVLLAHTGGDEFAVLLEPLPADPEQARLQAKQLADQLHKAMRSPLQVQDQHHKLSLSIGIVMFDGHQGVKPEELLKRADIAMYQAKAHGRNTTRFFDAVMEHQLAQRVQLEAELQQAIDQEHLELFYQPQVDADNRIIGVEALVRWRHPERGLIAPGDFIPLAEETGLILPLGRWVLQEACRQQAVWNKYPATASWIISVNVCSHQIFQTDFVDTVIATLRETGATPDRLQLELTESVLAHNIEEVIDKMAQLVAHGLTFSIDDFGTGYSSLNYLKRLPLRQLKIDASFVRDLQTDVNDVAIARTIIALGRTLDLEVIAEGVENLSQREILLDQGCQLFQGYFFSRPLPLAELEQVFAHPATTTRT